jgi:hypothetical protein
MPSKSEGITVMLFLFMLHWSAKLSVPSVHCTSSSSYSLNFLCYMKNCPSTRCVKAANLFRRCAKMFRTPNTALQQILCQRSIFGHKLHFLVAMQFDNIFSPSVRSATKLTKFCPPFLSFFFLVGPPCNYFAFVFLFA